jgi:hypothetical protein
VVRRKETRINQKTFTVALCAILFALCFSVEAQQVKKIPLIGVLIPGSQATYAIRIDAFRSGLRELGYIEGQNIAIEARYADGKSERLVGLAADLVRAGMSS